MQRHSQIGRIRILALLIVGAIAIWVLGMYGFVPNIFVLRVIREWRPRTEAKLAQIEKLRGALANARVTSETWKQDSITQATGISPTAENTVALHEEYLADLTRDVESWKLPVEIGRASCRERVYVLV